VKGEPAGDAWFPPLLGVVAAAFAGSLGWLAADGAGAALGAAAGAAVGLALARRRGLRARRRQVLRREGLPERARLVLEETCDPYLRLPAELKRRFETDVGIFLDEKRITGVEAEVTEELRLLVAASAVTLSLGWPAYDWSQLTEVLLYPQDFDRDYGFEEEELAGQTHPWGTVILSIPSLEESFATADDAYHVGFHEFAHLLDLEETRFAGIPRGLPEARAAEWVEVREREMNRLRKGRSVLDPYGADEPVEFFAVAVEAFFEVPQEMRARHARLYELLAGYFGQDPAAWDDARGL
jgi:Mlc titration factor MtfA (ptsG expression regulator)